VRGKRDIAAQINADYLSFGSGKDFAFILCTIFCSQTEIQINILYFVEVLKIAGGFAHTFDHRFSKWEDRPTVRIHQRNHLLKSFTDMTQWRLRKFSKREPKWKSRDESYLRCPGADPIPTGGVISE